VKNHKWANLKREETIDKMLLSTEQKT